MFLQLPEEIENKIWRMAHEMIFSDLEMDLIYYFEERAPHYHVDLPCIVMCRWEGYPFGSERIICSKKNYFHFLGQEKYTKNKINPNFQEEIMTRKTETTIVTPKFLSTLRQGYKRKETVLKMLRENGVDTSKIPKHKTIKELKKMLIKI